MRVKVLKNFKDKYTGKLYHTNERITVTAERFEEILTKGAFVERVQSRKKAESKTEE